MDGKEYYIPRGVLYGGEVKGGTRTIDAFGGPVAPNRERFTQ